ncbi:MAG: DUF937 domain-containing protein [Acidobacteriota bacterium]
MPDLVHQLTYDLGPTIATHLNNTLGIDPETSGRLLKQITPLILGGLNRQLQERGVEHVDQLLTRHDDEQTLENLGERFRRIANAQGSELDSGDLLGDTGSTATQVLADHFALDADDARRIIPMLTPVVLAALAKKRDREALGAEGIAALIQEDGDARVLDDVQSFLRRRLAPREKKSWLAGLLGQLLLGR